MLDIAWPAVGSIAAGAAVVSLLMSIVACTSGDPATAGFTTSPRPLVGGGEGLPSGGGEFGPAMNAYADLAEIQLDPSGGVRHCVVR
ncbi:holin [Nonomuraea sp. NBC_00507]|uniref:holin n=1 Tax=Nonomuraea sp. NBC_00507 TaxID=2976002 RepID=UPI003FA5538A